MRDSAALLQDFEGMFSDSDTDIRRYTTQVVKTRKPHFCPGYSQPAGHTIPPGTTTVLERAIVDGKWRSSYTCEACIDAWNQEKPDAE